MPLKAYTLKKTLLYIGEHGLIEQKHLTQKSKETAVTKYSIKLSQTLKPKSHQKPNNQSVPQLTSRFLPCPSYFYVALLRVDSLCDATFDKGRYYLFLIVTIYTELLA